MAEQFFFVRKRGEISGPFTVPQLQGLHARGLFARFNEVSVDQVHWQPAGSVEGLFSGPTVSWSQPPATVPPPAAPERPPADAVEWFYMDLSDTQVGPVALQELQRLLDAGLVDAATPVCKFGMVEWVELGTLPELHVPATTAGPTLVGQDAPGRPASSRRSSALRTAAFVTPVVSVVLVAIFVWASVSYFLQDRQAEGVLFAFLGLIVFLLSGVTAILLAVLSLRQAATARKTDRP
jgi:hypothetical protein